MAEMDKGIVNLQETVCQKICGAHDSIMGNCPGVKNKVSTEFLKLSDCALSPQQKKQVREHHKNK